MSEAVKRYAKAQKEREAQEKKDGEDDRPLPPREQRALKTMQREAKERGSDLASGGKGGLPPSLVLGVMRRDKYKCKVCGELGDMDENGGLSVHHKGGIPESKWLSKKGHSNDPNNIVSICAKCHDEVHEKARAEGNDSSQKKPEGDKEE